MDDIDLGASVWATPSSANRNIIHIDDELDTSSTTFVPLPPSEIEGDAFDDDDFSFSAPIQGATLNAEDDFGDFGDFGGAEDFGSVGQRADSAVFAQASGFDDGDAFFTPQSAEWKALRLDPMPSSSELKDVVEEILQPYWNSVDASDFLTDENIRQVGGPSQVLVTSTSRSLHDALYQSSLPNIHPPNWTRSRIRRRHLVSLGIPVNLDEVLPHVNGRPMPALQITTRPSSAPPGPRALERVTSPPPATSNSRPGSRPGTPKPAVARATSVAQLGLGPKPEIDEERIKQELSLTQESLTLLPLPTLRAHLASIRNLTTDSSVLLAHLLQQRDALQQDSEMYNGLIAELVGEAQKMKSGPKTRTGGSRRSSGIS